MHPTARKCVEAAAALWVAGAALVGVAPSLYGLASGWLGGLLDIAVGFLQEALIPTGAVLVGAAVVVQALRGTRPSLVQTETTLSGAIPTVRPPTGGVPTVRPVTGATPVVGPVTGAVAEPTAPLSPSPLPPVLTGAVPTAQAAGAPAGPEGGPSVAGPAEPAPASGAVAVAGKRPPRSRKKR